MIIPHPNIEKSWLIAAAGSWPGLCITFLNLVKGDLGKKRADPAVLRTVKKFFQKADEPRKSGRQGMLAHR